MSLQVMSPIFGVISIAIMSKVIMSKVIMSKVIMSKVIISKVIVSKVIVSLEQSASIDTLRPFINRILG